LLLNFVVIIRTYRYCTRVIATVCAVVH